MGFEPVEVSPAAPAKVRVVRLMAVGLWRFESEVLAPELPPLLVAVHVLLLFPKYITVFTTST
jgi:hypothetical protein